MSTNGQINEEGTPPHSKDNQNDKNDMILDQANANRQVDPPASDLAAPPVAATSRSLPTAVVSPTPAFEVNFNAPMSVKLANLLDSKGLTDVEFVVGEGQTRIRAHKLILAISSPVFLSMFYGSLPSESVIKLPDCDSDAFTTLINFIYGIGVTDITLEGVGETLETKTLPVLYVAHKYDIQGLQEVCSMKLSYALNPWNVLSILATAELYGLEDLKLKCWTLIQHQTRSVLNFHQHSIDYQNLLRIVQDDGLSIEEVKLFEFLNSWAELECEKDELVPTVDNKLRRLGDILKYVRFPTMSSSDFANRVASKGLLSEEQVAKILTYICSTPQNKQCLRLDFPASRRRGQKALDDGLFSIEAYRSVADHLGGFESLRLPPAGRLFGALSSTPPTCFGGGHSHCGNLSHNSSLNNGSNCNNNGNGRGSNFSAQGVGQFGQLGGWGNPPSHFGSFGGAVLGFATPFQPNHSPAPRRGTLFDSFEDEPRVSPPASSNVLRLSMEAHQRQFLNQQPPRNGNPPTPPSPRERFHSRRGSGSGGGASSFQRSN